MARTVDLEADLNSQDDEGVGWSVLRDARDPDSVVPGATLVAGNEMATAIVHVVAVDHDGQVHFSILPGSVDENTHLLLGDPDWRERRSRDPRQTVHDRGQSRRTFWDRRPAHESPSTRRSVPVPLSAER